MSDEEWASQWKDISLTDAQSMSSQEIQGTIRALAADVERLVQQKDDAETDAQEWRRKFEGLPRRYSRAAWADNLREILPDRFVDSVLDEIDILLRDRQSAEALATQEREALIRERKERYDLERQEQAITEELRASQALVERLREALTAVQRHPDARPYLGSAVCDLVDAVLVQTPAQAGEERITPAITYAEFRALGEELRLLRSVVDAAKALADWADSPQMLDQQGAQIRQGLGHKAVANVRAALTALEEQQR